MPIVGLDVRREYEPMPPVVRDLGSGQRHELGDTSLIGRAEGADVRLSDGSVSRQHAAIRFEDGRFWIVDLGSANGTFVNGVALSAARVLQSGDRLQVGASVLVFELEDAAPDPGGVHADRTELAQLPPVPLRSTPVTLLVADLKGFTAICERLTAGQVADLLREWYADCEAVLKRHGASIDKFIGDCVFAYWHGTGPSVRFGAVRAAEALRAVEAAPVSATRLLLRAEAGIALDCRIGIHVGQVAMGAMGKGISTALGDAVNMAFRIEGLTRFVQRPMLVSAAFLEGWPEGAAAFESCGRHEIKGYRDAIEVFAPRHAERFGLREA